MKWDVETLEGDKSYTKGLDVYERGKLIVNGFMSHIKSLTKKNGEKILKECGEAAKVRGDMCLKGCAHCAIFNT